MKKAFGILLLVLFVCTSCGDKSEPSFKVYDEYSKEKKVEKKNNIGRGNLYLLDKQNGSQKIARVDFQYKNVK